MPPTGLAAIPTCQRRLKNCSKNRLHSSPPCPLRRLSVNGNPPESKNRSRRKTKTIRQLAAGSTANQAGKGSSGQRSCFEHVVCMPPIEQLPCPLVDARR